MLIKQFTSVSQLRHNLSLLELQTEFSRGQKKLCIKFAKNSKFAVTEKFMRSFVIAEHGETILRLESGIKTNAEKINSNFGIFEEEVKRLDDKNKQFSTDVSDKHEYIKELIGTTQTNLQTEIAESCATVKVNINLKQIKIVIKKCVKYFGFP